MTSVGERAGAETFGEQKLSFRAAIPPLSNRQRGRLWSKYAD
jgi:hypothetical protein